MREFDLQLKRRRRYATTPGAGLPPSPDTEIALLSRRGRLSTEARILIEHVERAMS